MPLLKSPAWLVPSRPISRALSSVLASHARPILEQSFKACVKSSSSVASSISVGTRSFVSETHPGAPGRMPSAELVVERHVESGIVEMKLNRASGKNSLSKQLLSEVNSPNRVAWCTWLALNDILLKRSSRS